MSYASRNGNNVPNGRWNKNEQNPFPRATLRRPRARLREGASAAAAFAAGIAAASSAAASAASASAAATESLHCICRDGADQMQYTDQQQLPISAYQQQYTDQQHNTRIVFNTRINNNRRMANLRISAT